MIRKNIFYPLFLKRIILAVILNKEKLVLIRKERSYHQNHEIIFPIKTPHEGKVDNSNYANSLHSLLHPIVNLIIKEAAGTPPPDPFFVLVYITLLMARRLNDPGTDN